VLVVEEIRWRHLKTYEYAEPNMPGASEPHPGLVNEIAGPYAILKRLEAKQSFFDKVLSLEPKFLAVFGRDKTEIFKRLYSARRQVIVTAETLIEDIQSGAPASNESRMQYVKWRKQIFASPGTVDLRMK
jgi:hypothetical protein